MIRFVSVLILAAAFVFNMQAQELKSIEKIDDIKNLMADAKGKVVLLNFWASWCAPCVKEFPEIIKLYKNYKDRGFVVYFVSLDDLPDIDSKVRPFLKRQGVDFTTYYSNFSKPEELMDYIDKHWQGAIPATYFYDKEGTMMEAILGGRKYEDFEARIKKYID